MRWVLATDDFPPVSGGIATWTEAVAGELHRRGQPVLVLARSRAGLGKNHPYDVRGVLGPSFGAWGPRWMGMSLWKHLTEKDRLLCTTWPMALHAWERTARLDIGLDVTFHGSDLTMPARDTRGFQNVVEGANRWAISDYLRGLLDARAMPATTLPAPIDPAPARQRPTECGHWGLVARAAPLKGIERFIRLVAQAGVRATIVGDGPVLHASQKLARELGADVSFTGALPRHSVLDAMRTMDLCCLLPTTDRLGTGAEGLGFTLLEAASVGVPVVGCRTGGVPEAVGPGLLLEDPDDVDASVQAIVDWWTPSHGATARDWLAEHHGVAKTVDVLTA